jgi:hypothetical protein
LGGVLTSAGVGVGGIVFAFVTWAICMRPLQRWLD